MTGTSGRQRLRSSTLLPIAEHRQAEVCDSSSLDNIIATGDMMNPSSSSSGKRWKMTRPLVKLKKAFVEIMMSEPAGGSSNSCYSPGAYAMGMGMVPVDFAGYAAASSIMARSLY